MELQWPLILFTTFVAWSAGLFGIQGMAALANEGKRAQMTALVTSVVLLAAGGIAVFFHLEHWERIFNGFGNPTSGITQELVCVVVLGVLMVVVFALLRRSSVDAAGPVLPKWLAVLMTVAAALLVLVTGHSYMMAARPAWDSLLGPLTLLGTAAATGALTFAVVETLRGESVGKCVSVTSLVGAAANLVVSVAYLVVMELSTTSYANVGFYHDPTHPTANMVDVAALSPFAGGSAAMSVVMIVALVVSVAATLVGKKTGNWKLWGAAGAACAIVGAVALRMVFYSVGASVYLFY